MTRKRFTAYAATALLASGAVVTGFVPANADTLTYDTTFTPGTSDIVGVGSDTTQIVVKHLADAYNSGKSSGRIATFQAPTDTTNPGTITLRSGTTAITRPDGSTAGKSLLYGSGNNTNVDFARSSSTLSAAEIAGGLEQAPFATDGLKIAVDATSTNAPSSLDLATLYKIYTGVYTNWNQVPGSTKSGTIDAYIPQSGSGTRKFFEAQLLTVSSASSITYGSNVKTTQEHSDTDLKSDVNAIAPFSTARAASLKTIKLLGGFSATRAIYDVVRTADLAGSRGATLKAAFGSTGFFCSAAGRQVIEADGFKQLAPGICGVWGTTAPSSLTTTGDAATATTTSLSATAVGQAVTLKAVVKPAKSAGVAGTLAFYDGTTKVGTKVATSSSAVSLALAKVTKGTHAYSVVFTPTTTALNASTSKTVSVAVRYTSTTALSVKSGKATVTVALPYAKGTTATGTVTVYSGSKPVGKATLSKGKASIKLSITRKGTYKLVAKYAGSSSVAGSNSKTVTYTK